MKYYPNTNKGVPIGCTSCDPMDYSLLGYSVHMILQAKITEMGCHFLLQGNFLTQGLNPRLLHWQALLTTEPRGK